MRLADVFIRLSLPVVVFLLLTLPLSASVTRMNFDSMLLSAGQCADATSYLAGFGINFIGLTPNTSPVICNGTGTGAIPVSGPDSIRRRWSSQ